MKTGPQSSTYCYQKICQSLLNDYICCFKRMNASFMIRAWVDGALVSRQVSKPVMLAQINVPDNFILYNYACVFILYNNAVTLNMLVFW